MRPTYQYSARPSGTLEYPALREALDERYASLPPEDIEQLVYEMFGPAVQAEDLESIFGSIGKAFSNLGPTLSNIAQQAAPVIARVAPAAAQGAVTGAGIGGPYGALAGLGVGILSSLLGGGGAPAPGGAPPRPAPSAAGIPQPSAPSAPALPAGAAAASPAAAALASLVSRPELGNVLKSAIMGSHGRPSVPVGQSGTQVGVDAFMQLLGALATQASIEHALLTPEQDESVPAYLEGRDLDPAVPEHRAAALYELFREADRDEALAERRLARAGAARGFEAYRENGGEAYRDNGAETARFAEGSSDEADDGYREVEYAMAMGRLLGEQDVTDAWDDSDDQ